MKVKGLIKNATHAEFEYLALCHNYRDAKLEVKIISSMREEQWYLKVKICIIQEKQEQRDIHHTSFVHDGKFHTYVS